MTMEWAPNYCNECGKLQQNFRIRGGADQMDLCMACDMKRAVKEQNRRKRAERKARQSIAA